MSAPLADTAILIAGHGSSKAPETAGSVHAHVAAMRARSTFASVEAGFLKQTPFLADRVDALLADVTHVVIVPFMTSNGYVTTTLMPQALGSRTQDRRVVFADAVGTHPLIAETAARDISATMKTYGLQSNDTHLLVVGHGTRRNPINERSTRRFARAVQSALPVGVSSDIALLEHAPKLDDWHTRTARRHVFVIPFLMAGGHHGHVDVPDGLGLDPRGPCIGRLRGGAPWVGPFGLRRRRLWLSRPVGFMTAATDALEARALEALNACGVAA